MESINLNYSVDISESSTENGDFIIQGTAINATTTDNGHRFLVEELRPAAKGMAGIPLLVDHDALVANIKGRVLAGTFNEAQEKIDFKAKVMDKISQDMIKDKRITSVSIGANVKEIEENDDGTITARGIKIKELSLVAVPADDGATFAIAMNQAFNKIKEGKENLQKLKGGLSEKMEENDNAKILEAIESMGKSFTEKIETMDKVFTEKLEAMKESDADEAEAKAKAEEEAKKEADANEEANEEAKAKEEADAKAEEEADKKAEEDAKAEEGSKLDFVEGNGSLRGHSFSYNW